VTTVTDVLSLRAAVREARDLGKTVSFVPTMGALHRGHLSLVERAREDASFAVVSIFVNPLQFAPGEDFAKYPRSPQQDAALLESAGVDLLYLPSPDAFYPPDFSTSVDVSQVSEGGEGSVRPGHFRGVATVVAKLLHQVGPDVLWLGGKDLQQVAVLRRMIRDLDFPVRLAVGETIRDDDGLALSSRNAYLSSAERVLAAALPRALFAARARARSGQRDARQLERDTRTELERAGLSVDYVEAIEAETMRRVEKTGPGAVLTAAVRVGRTRLIDNVPLVEE
jgi:pantoate--beta-alanine ligase